MAYEPTEDEFAYWGNEGGNDQIQLILALSEQVADLQVEVENQGAIIDELSENVTYKSGAVKPRISTKGVGRMRRIPMKPEAMAKYGVRMGAKTLLAKLGVSIPFLGIIIGVIFQEYEGIMKKIADDAAKAAVRKHEKEELEQRRVIIKEVLDSMDKDTREKYRSLIP